MNANEQFDFYNPDSMYYANSKHYIAQLEAMSRQQQAEIEALRKSHIELERGIVKDLNQRQSAEPVAWMHQNPDYAISKHQSLEYNIPLYTQDQLEEARKLGMQQERAMWNLSASTQEIIDTHPVTEHFEGEPQAEELHEIMQSNAELTDAETALKSLYEAIIRYENLSLFPDKYAIESCEYQLHDAKEKARAILRKAQEK